MKKFKKTALSLALLAGILGTVLVSPALPGKKKPWKPNRPPAKTKAIPGALPIDINY